MHLLINKFDKYNDGIENINKKEKIYFIKNTKNKCFILKKKMNKEYLTHKGQNHKFIKNKKVFNSNKYYIYNIINNKIFIILNIFVIFFLFFFKAKFWLKLAINSKNSINENEINLEEKLYYNTFIFEENIIKIYHSNPPDCFKNMFNYNYYIKKADLTNIEISNFKDMNSMLQIALHWNILIWLVLIHLQLQIWA